MANAAYRVSVTKSANHPGPAELTTTIFSHNGTAARTIVTHHGKVEEGEEMSTDAVITYEPIGRPGAKSET